MANRIFLLNSGESEGAAGGGRLLLKDSLNRIASVGRQIFLRLKEAEEEPILLYSGEHNARLTASVLDKVHRFRRTRCCAELSHVRIADAYLLLESESSTNVVCITHEAECAFLPVYFFKKRFGSERQLSSLVWLKPGEAIDLDLQTRTSVHLQG